MDYDDEDKTLKDVINDEDMDSVKDEHPYRVAMMNLEALKALAVAFVDVELAAMNSVLNDVVVMMVAAVMDAVVHTFYSMDLTSLK